MKHPTSHDFFALTFFTSTMPPTNTPAAGDLDLDQDVKVLLTIKKGPRSGSPRRGETVIIPVKLSQGFDVFRASILSFRRQPPFRTSRLLEENIYFKKSKGSPQTAYVRLQKTNFVQYFKERWAYIPARDVDPLKADGETPQKAFSFECFVYIEHPDKKGSVATLSRRSTTIERTVNTTRQPEHLMAERVRERRQAQNNERHEWRNVRMKLNGAVVEVPVELSSLREALGLPNYPLFRDGIFHSCLYVHPTCSCHRG